MKLEPGTQLGRYEIRESLGTGGMGEVFLAWDNELGRKVAVKMLSAKLAADPMFRARFQKEVQAIATLSHPNILAIHDTGKEQGRPYAVMELLEGENLRGCLESRLSWKKAASLGIDIAKGLAAAHEKGIIHRDLKPENIFITTTGQVKILDFGLAQVPVGGKATGTETQSLEIFKTKPGEVVGTTAYMSPEQAQGLPLDHRSDIFSLGSILYEMLGGRHPFKQKTPIRTMLAVAERAAPDLAPLAGDAPPDLVSLVMKCLAKKPENRPQSATDLVVFFKELLRESEMSTLPAPLLKKRGWHLPKAFLGTLGVILLLGFLYLADRLDWDFRKLWPRSQHMGTPGGVVPQRVTLAMLHFENQTGNPELDWLEKGIPDMLINQFGFSKYLQIISTEKIRDVVKTLEINDGELDRKTTEDMIRRTKADFMITGTVVQAGGSFRILATIHNLKRERLLKTEMVEGEGQERLFGLIDELAAKIKLALELKASGSAESLEDFVKVKTKSLDAYRYYVQGLEFMHEYHDREAITLFRKAIQLDPGFAHAHLYLAKAYDILGETDLARETMAKAIEFSDNLPLVEQLRFSLAEAELKSDWPAAFEILKRLSVAQPEEARWHFKLGFHYEIHDYDLSRGIFAYRKALEIDAEGTPLVYRYYGNALLKVGHEEQALQAFKTFNRLLPEAPLSHDSLGYGYLRVGRYEEALQAFETALRLKPDYLMAMGHLGEYYMALGRYAMAEQVFEKYSIHALSRNEERDGLLYKARLLFFQNRFEASLEVLDQAHQFAPDFLQVHWLAGLNQLGLNRIEAAEASAGAMAAILTESGSRYNEDYYLHLSGRISAARERPDRAIDEFHQVLNRGADERLWIQTDLAQTYFTNGYADLAKETCDEILRVNPNYAPALFLLGNLYTQREELDKGRRYYQSFLTLWKEADGAHPWTVVARKRLTAPR